MKLKLDEDLPESLAVALGRLGLDTETVRQEGMAGHKDSAVWAEAQAAKRFLITDRVPKQ